MVKRAAFIAAFIGLMVGYCLPQTPSLTLKDGQVFEVCTYLEDTKNAGTGVFIYDGGHTAVSNKRAIDSPLKHSPLHNGENYIVKFKDDTIIEWYRLK